ncbi:MAG: hypothetical protein AB1801_22560 [Chloroflexota bacterium]
MKGWLNDPRPIRRDLKTLRALYWAVDDVVQVTSWEGASGVYMQSLNVEPIDW